VAELATHLFFCLKSAASGLRPSSNKARTASAYGYQQHARRNRLLAICAPRAHLIPNPFKAMHALRSEKRKPGKGLWKISRDSTKSLTPKRVTFRSAEGQREPNQPDLGSNPNLYSGL